MATKLRTVYKVSEATAARTKTPKPMETMTSTRVKAFLAGV
jgi:hypothetical protein